MPFNSRNEHMRVIDADWRAISGGPWARVHLLAGESVRAESDAAVSMSENVEVCGRVHGGILSGVRRALLGGESIFQQELR